MEGTARRRADAERNQGALLDAAAEVFADAGVDAPVRAVAAAAGVGMGTLYRHFPTRSDLVVAVYRHQVEACAQAGPELLAASPTPYAAVAAWVRLFTDFLATKHGLARVWQGEDAGFAALHQLFLDRLVPVLADLLDAARTSGEVLSDTTALELLRAVGDLVAHAPDDGPGPARAVGLLVAGLRQPPLEPFSPR